MLKNGVGVFVSQKCNEQTDTSFTDKHGRLGHVVGTREMSRGRSLTFYLVFNNMGHGRKKQMRLCIEFNAGPSKE